MSLFKTGHHLEDELTDAPNPKPTATDKAHFGKLASLYTAFSSDFAAYALDMCLRVGGNRIADPFSGMGTLAEAARTRPVILSVGDISPFAALSGAFRSATRTHIDLSAALLETQAAKMVEDNERAFYSQLFKTLAATGQNSISTILATPSKPKHRILAISIYLAALSRIHLYKRFAGSNPTWVKRPDAIADGSSTLEAINATIRMGREFARHLPDIHHANRTKSVWASIDAQPIAKSSLDAIVTSPPYANRTDYIRHYLPASELLLNAAGRDERLIRIHQIGTPLIRKVDPEQPLPVSIRKLLEAIRTHPSYASERYYYKGFLYYFVDMYDAFVRMRDWLQEGGILLMVVQDTCYKDLYVPTASLLADLAQTVGFKISGRRDWRVLHHLSHLSPHSRRVMPKRTLNESVIAFSK